MKSPDSLLMDHLRLFEGLHGPILDLACGGGHNGIFLASRGHRVVLADVSEEALAQAKAQADEQGIKVTLWHVDLEKGEDNPLPEDSYVAILVFRYLHRPLMSGIKKALKKNGIIVYETFTVDQPRFGRPKNPDHLLKPRELLDWFRGWEVIYQFEGILQDPERSVGQIVGRKT